LPIRYTWFSQYPTALLAVFIAPTMVSTIQLVFVLFAAMIGSLAQNCVDDCYLEFIPETGCPGASDPNAPATPAYLQCVCQSFNSGPLADYLACVSASCNSPGVLSFFTSQCAAFPSMRARHKRDQKALDAGTICPKPRIACPIQGYTEYQMQPSSKGAVMELECIDPNLDIDSCGGCATLGTGVACETLEGVKSTSCVNGVCQIYSCKPGYILGSGRNSKGESSKSCRMATIPT